MITMKSTLTQSALCRSWIEWMETRREHNIRLCPRKVVSRYGWTDGDGDKSWILIVVVV